MSCASIKMKVYTGNGGCCNGKPGEDGVTGPTGPIGFGGLGGATGPTGAVGPGTSSSNTGGTGPIGDQGAQGPSGPTGGQGIEGPRGPTGPTGDTGFTGATGPTGPTGLIGPGGTTGATGPADLNINMINFSAFFQGSPNLTDPSGTWSIDPTEPNPWNPAGLRTNRWWIYPGGGAAESAAATPSRYWRSTQPLRVGWWPAPGIVGSTQYYTSPPLISIPWSYARITHLAYSFGGNDLTGTSPPTNSGWNNSNTMNGWNIEVWSYCATDNSGASPVGEARDIYCPSGSYCGCIAINPPLTTHCIPGATNNSNAISVNIQPHMTGIATWRPPRTDGFITIGLKLEIVKP